MFFGQEQWLNRGWWSRVIVAPQLMGNVYQLAMPTAGGNRCYRLTCVQQGESVS